MNATKSILLASVLAGVALPSNAQRMKMGEVIFISNSKIKPDVQPQAVTEFVSNAGLALTKAKPGVSVHLFQADRGDRKGEYLLVSGVMKAEQRKGLAKSPFTDKAFSAGGSKTGDFLVNPDSYTEYRLVGAEKFSSLPAIDLLGIHYIKVKPERAADFDRFVVEKLHPEVGQKLLPDMKLLYYKAVSGENAGSYITIFAIESVAAREKYWPTGAPETEVLKAAFRPLKGLAKELSAYFVEGSYLLPDSGGGAAYFESREWTDFVVTN